MTKRRKPTLFRIDLRCLVRVPENSHHDTAGGPAITQWESGLDRLHQSEPGVAHPIITQSCPLEITEADNNGPRST